MASSTIFLLFAAATLLVSCSPGRQQDPKDKVRQASAPLSQSTAPRSHPDLSTPAAAEPEAIAQRNDSAPQPTDRDRSSEPTGVLPLTPGVYVLAGAGCSAPANAGVRFYDGRGISGSATHACRTQVRSRRENTYVVEQSCIDTPTGDGPRSSESQTITVRDVLTFALVTADESARFGYCPMGDLPEYLRQRVALDGSADADN